MDFQSIVVEYLFYGILLGLPIKYVMLMGHLPVGIVFTFHEK